MTFDFLHAIFARKQTGQSTDPIVAIGGQNISGSYIGAIFDATGALIISGGGSGAGTATSIVSISGTPNVNVAQWGGSNVLSASAGVPTVGWFQRLDATNDAVTAYQSVSNSNWSVVASQSGNWTISAGTMTIQGSIGAGTVTVSAVLAGTMTVGAVLAGTMSSIAYGQARTSDQASVANAAIVPLMTDSLGKAVVLPGAVGDLHLDGGIQVAGVLTASLIATAGAGRRIAVQSILVTCSGSQTVQAILFGGIANRTLGFAAPGGGFSLNAGGAPLYITSANIALSVAGDVTSTFDIYASGYSMSN